MDQVKPNHSRTGELWL